MKRVPGPLLSLVLLLVKPGIVTSTTRELCRPDLDDLLDLLVLLGAVEERGVDHPPGVTGVGIVFCCDPPWSWKVHGMVNFVGGSAYFSSSSLEYSQQSADKAESLPNL